MNDEQKRQALDAALAKMSRDKLVTRERPQVTVTVGHTHRTADGALTFTPALSGGAR